MVVVGSDSEIGPDSEKQAKPYPVIGGRSKPHHSPTQFMAKSSKPKSAQIHFINYPYLPLGLSVWSSVRPSLHSLNLILLPALAHWLLLTTGWSHTNLPPFLISLYDLSKLLPYIVMLQISEQLKWSELQANCLKAALSKIYAKY